MSLDTTLADITVRLRETGFPNEQAITQGIVLRVLPELGWDTCDWTAVVWPKYQTGGGRANFALCHPPSKPAIWPSKPLDGAARTLRFRFEPHKTQ